MHYKEFTIGDKVRIISKNRGMSLGESNVYKDGGGIGYVVNNNNRYITVSEKKGDSSGDYFAHEDLELYDDDPTIDDIFDDIISAL